MPPCACSAGPTAAGSSWCAGKGNNGNDGREAARRLRRRGVRVHRGRRGRPARPAAGLRPRDRRRLRDGVPGRVAGPDRRATRCSPSTSPPGWTASPGRCDGPGAVGGPHGHLRRPQARPGPCSRRRAAPARSRWPTSASTCPRPGPTSSRRRDVAGWLPAPAERRPQVAGRGAGGRRLAGDDRCRPPDAAAAFRAGAGYVTSVQPRGRRRPDRADRGRRPCRRGDRLGRGGARRRRSVRRAGGRSRPGRRTGPGRRRPGAGGGAGPVPSSSTATA